MIDPEIYAKYCQMRTGNPIQTISKGSKAPIFFFKGIEVAETINASRLRFDDIKFKKIRKDKWYESDYILLIRYYKMGYTNKDIGILLNRTTGSIKNKIIFIRNKYPNIKHKIKPGKYWSKFEIDFLTDHIKLGYKLNKIAKKLNRDPMSVYNKIKELNSI